MNKPPPLFFLVFETGGSKFEPPPPFLMNILPLRALTCIIELQIATIARGDVRVTDDDDVKRLKDGAELILS